MHACRIARAATGREKILKFEGAYHGLHDTALVSVKPKAEDYGDPDATQFRSRGRWRAKGRARECCRRQLQQSEERRKSF